MKDIQAFANAWKETDAYILIGIRDKHAPPAEVVGVESQLDDATLQELVNKKTNRAVLFEYIPLTYDDLPIAVIRIQQKQERPLFLKKTFGRLKPNTVYMRRGSSTTEATPDEIAKMGGTAAISAPTPLLSIRAAEQREGTGGTSSSIVSTILEEKISPDEWAAMARVKGSQPDNMRAYALAAQDKPSPEEIRRFLAEKHLLRPFVVEVNNPGQTLAADVRVELRFDALDGL